MSWNESGPGFADYWRSIRRRTRRLLGLVPPDRIEWRPGTGRWSFGDQFRHLAAIERWMFLENVSGRPSRYPGHDPALATGREAVGAFMDRLHQESLTLLEDLPADRLAATCRTPAGAEIAAAKWLRAMVEHEVHHRGQIYLMLGLIGVEAPPLFGLTEEEVLARSS